MSSDGETKHLAGSGDAKTEVKNVSDGDMKFKLQSDRFRWSYEDPMHDYIKLQKLKDKEERIKELQSLLESSENSSVESVTPRRKQKKIKKKKPVTEKWIEKTTERTDGSSDRTYSMNRNREKQFRQFSDASIDRSYRNGDKEFKQHTSKAKKRKRDHVDTGLDGDRDKTVHCSADKRTECSGMTERHNSSRKKSKHKKYSKQHKTKKCKERVDKSLVYAVDKTSDHRCSDRDEKHHKSIVREKIKRKKSQHKHKKDK